jgi:hypothetical protein
MATRFAGWPYSFKLSCLPKTPTNKNPFFFQLRKSCFVTIGFRTYNPNKDCQYLMQRREGVEKARKEKHFKKREQSFFASFRAFLSVFALVF